MTKSRKPMTVEDALHRILGTNPEALTVTGKSESWFRQCADPDNDTKHLHMKDAIAIDAWMQAHGEHPVLVEAIIAETDERVRTTGGAPPHNIGDAVQRICLATKEVAEAVTAYGKVRNGDVSCAALHEARREIGEGIEALQLAQRDLDAMEAGNVAQMGAR